ncbi:uncharacterized protein N7443_008577 [Penicillium atrosanguineum]|uniref:Zn(2)-C6 fungal-type domain-containing protein n=1 Tax=Penicillium atrosanguineum TaxID=1132637 RepID=A0A9W9PPQ4_9EURO|nr:uncharacterized protein N7443_008577 [Penicillium atrosanguineum]KAJ5125507.1 hypothetical protein N7526_007684 [Penicillium atrosanguineum]KAJ5292624.1 hypothetical protein N7443_008577 [Penicillium atrosanguineum]KAJ5303352.1 hypothetical protein N7476_010151 [Penicillium atrosanguineum]
MATHRDKNDPGMLLRLPLLSSPQRRQKCDEAKPACGRCLHAGIACEYTVILKWNGRVPREAKSSAIGFISDSTSTSLIDRSSNPNFTPSALDIERPLTALSSQTQLLLHHFLTEVSQNSSHAYLRDNECQDILSMVHHSDSLRYAVMAMSALHRSTLVNGLPDQFIPEATVLKLISTSINYLRRDLEVPDFPSQPLLHTIKTLCHCEIFSGRADSSWRVHVNGAGAFLAAMASQQDPNGPTSGSSLCSRWFWSIQALAAVTDFGFLSVQTIGSTMQGGSDDYYFDIYTGYSSDLNIALMQIGLLAHQRSMTENNREDDNEYHDQIRRLERAIRNMISRDHELGLKFPIHHSLDTKTTNQFRACNTAYQTASLIHLYRRVQSLPTFCIEVQRCVRDILDAVCMILPVTTLSPWILLTTPIYTAGCEAVGSDRKVVKDLLLELYSKLHIRNIIRAIEILEQRWRMLDISKDILSGPEDMKTAGLLDFIPY